MNLGWVAAKHGVKFTERSFFNFAIDSTEICVLVMLQDGYDELPTIPADPEQQLEFQFLACTWLYSLNYLTSISHCNPEAYIPCIQTLMLDCT